MSNDLLATKLYIPHPKSDLVPRSRLIERMDTAANGDLTLVSAPAGFGKTTMLSKWVSASSRRTCWLSLDPMDSDPARFFTYLISAIRTIEPTFGTEIFNLLQTQKSPLNETLLMSLTNDLTAIREPFSLVLDDYHVIDNTVIDDAVHFLLEYLPPGMNLVISTRTDPGFPLARLRASGALTELRASDLKFTDDEIGFFFNDLMGLMLQNNDLQALSDRTEGWVASLQLAALSLQGREDKSTFIADFSGGHHYVIDYLVDEVMIQLSDEIRGFLLRTSILERFCAPLCDAVLGIKKSREILQYLEETNLFLIPLDDQRVWYRFHHLFAEFLHQRLRDTELDEIDTLHQRAAVWYKEEKLKIEAVEHALKAKDFPFAARLIENLGPQLMMVNEFDLLSRWLGCIPESFVETWPWLCIINAWMCHRWAKMDEVIKYLNHAEAVVLEHDPEKKKESTRIVLGQVCTLRALLPPGFTETPRVIANANYALELLPQDYFNRGAAALPLGIIYREQGDFDRSLNVLSESYRSSMRVKNRFLGQFLMLEIGRTHQRQGKLLSAVEAIREAIGLKFPQTNISIPYAGTARIVLGEILYEWNDMAAAEMEVQEGITIAAEHRIIEAIVNGYLIQTRLLLARGDPESAAVTWGEAEHIAQELPGLEGETQARMIATRTRLFLAKDQALLALEFLARCGLTPEHHDAIVPTEDWISLVRTMLHVGRSDPGSEFLSNTQTKLELLLEKSRTLGFKGTTIELLTMSAILLQSQNRASEAGIALSEALALAEPENMLRVFLDEGDILREILQKISVSSGDYASRVLNALNTPIVAQPSWRDLGLLDPLSERELEVLHLLTTDLSGPEIAQELIISLNTMRTHTKRIYSKLGVNSRRAAVRRAQELSL